MDATKSRAFRGWIANSSPKSRASSGWILIFMGGKSGYPLMFGAGF